MQETNNEVKRFLSENFEKVRETETGFRFNKSELNKRDLQSLDCIPANVEITIKRSGTGLVVIIN